MKILYTNSREDLLGSFAEILNCKFEIVENAISKLDCEYSDKISMLPFFKSIGINTNNRLDLFNSIIFEKIILSHFASRISEPKNKPFLNLYDVLTTKTEISKMFNKFGVYFQNNNGKIVTFYNNTEVNWDNYSYCGVPRIKRRLSLSNKFKDKGINGYLINDRIWENPDLRNLLYAPEIIQDISYALDIRELFHEWHEKSKLYCIGLEVKVVDIIFDGKSHYSLKQKIYCIYRYAINYLKYSKTDLWDPKTMNPMIRLKDNINLKPKKLFGYYEVEKSLLP
jgi:hypothetical protein